MNSVCRPLAFDTVHSHSDTASSTVEASARGRKEPDLKLLHQNRELVMGKPRRTQEKQRGWPSGAGPWLEPLLSLSFVHLSVPRVRHCPPCGSMWQPRGHYHPWPSACPAGLSLAHACSGPRKSWQRALLTSGMWLSGFHSDLPLCGVSYTVVLCA